jgi:hypothetical protein
MELWELKTLLLFKNHSRFFIVDVKLIIVLVLFLKFSPVIFTRMFHTHANLNTEIRKKHSYN